MPTSKNIISDSETLEELLKLVVSALFVSEFMFRCGVKNIVFFSAVEFLVFMNWFRMLWKLFLTLVPISY